MDVANQHAPPAASRTLADALDLGSLEPHAGKAETTHDQRESIGHRFSEDVQWPFPKEDIAGWLIAVTVGNDSNVCYQNSTMVAFLWAVCQLHEPCWNDFGPGAEKIADLFRQESVWVTLHAIPAFESFLKSWGSDQQDIGEFHFNFLSWLQPRCVNLEWRRLVQDEDQVLVQDHGDTYNPPTLQAPQTAGL